MQKKNGSVKIKIKKGKFEKEKRNQKRKRKGKSQIETEWLRGVTIRRGYPRRRQEIHVTSFHKNHKPNLLRFYIPFYQLTNLLKTTLFFFFSLFHSISIFIFFLLLFSSSIFLIIFHIFTIKNWKKKTCVLVFIIFFKKKC